MAVSIIDSNIPDRYVNPAKGELSTLEKRVHGMPAIRGRSRSAGEKTRSAPDEFTSVDDQDLEADINKEAIQSVHLETIRLQIQLSKMEEFARDQSIRQQSMGNTAN